MRASGHNLTPSASAIKSGGLRAESPRISSGLRATRTVQKAAGGFLGQALAGPLPACAVRRAEVSEVQRAGGRYEGRRHTPLSWQASHDRCSLSHCAIARSDTLVCSDVGIRKWMGSSSYPTTKVRES